MSSKRDLVEAHSFNRRRLITAFVSGAPGGREVEPVRYGRTLVGGAVLAGLLVAGAAVSGFLKPSVPDNWLDGGLVIGKESGSRFVAYKGNLYPVINTTSARLILAQEGELKVDFVPDDKIADQKPGATIGIPGAPDVLPAPDRLRATGWTACTNPSGGVKISVRSRPGVAVTPRGALLVSADKQLFVVTGEHRYAVPADARRAATLRAIGLDAEPARDVPGQWLDLVTPGSSLAPFDVPGQGQPVDTGVRGLDRVGAPVLVDGRPYVLGRGGRLVELTDFAYTLYRSSGPGAAFPELEVAKADVASLRTVNDPDQQPYPDDWPDEDVTAFERPDAPCLRLTASDGQAPTAALATATSDAVAAPAAPGVTRDVEAGLGAVVRGTSGGVLGSGQVFLVDATGTRYAVGTPGAEQSAMTSLGYGKVEPVPVPRSWVDLFRDGPQLSASAAARAAGSGT